MSCAFRRISLTCTLLLPIASIGCGASPTAPSTNIPPTLPLTARMTITNDMPGGQQILVPPRPVTFTVTTEGGTPPYEYQWRINNVLMRDWNQNQILAWDGLTLDGRPTVSGRYTLVVTRRTPGDTQFASATLLRFEVQYR
jgi:hypothetical protein